MENAKKKLVFHFEGGHHASFPQKPVVKGVSNLKACLDYCENQVRSCEHSEFSCSFEKITPKFALLFYTLQFGHENKDLIFHNFLPDFHNNPDELLNKKRLQLGTKGQ